MLQFSPALILPSSRFRWEQTSTAEGHSTTTVTWDIPPGVTLGTYRIQHFGYHKPLACKSHDNSCLEFEPLLRLRVGLGMKEVIHTHCLALPVLYPALPLPLWYSFTPLSLSAADPKPYNGTSSSFKVGN